jgi:hypothetical protein
MRFLITWALNETAASEADQARILALFSKWQPPAPLQEWSGFADGSGGMGLVETDDAEVLAAMTEVWTPWLTFDIKPLVPIERTAATMAEAAAFRSAVS